MARAPIGGCRGPALETGDRRGEMESPAGSENELHSRLEIAKGGEWSGGGQM